MNDPDQTIVIAAVTDDGLPEPMAVPPGGLQDQLWAYDDTPAPAERPAEEQRPPDEATGGLVSLGYLRAALRRNRRFWLAFGLIGLIVGCGLYVTYPPAYQASTSLYITNNPNVDALSAMLTNVTLVESRPVAQAVIDKLGLQQSAASLQAASVATVVTNQVLQITVTAPSSNGAVTLAQTLGQEFLSFRAQLLQQQQQQVQNTLNNQVTQAQQNLSAINTQISQVSAQPDTPARQSKLNALNVTRTKAETSIATLQQTATDNQATAATITASMIQGSQVLNPATADQHSRKKLALEYVASALIAGLALGIGIVVVRAIVSDRLRRRDDVADVLGAPVRLSVGDLRSRRWLLGRLRRPGGRQREAQRLIAYLRNAVPRDGPSPAALAVVAVDNAAVVAQPLVTLATSRAREGMSVVLADMSPGAPAARLLGVKEPGVHSVTAQDAHLTVAVGSRDDVAPVGPLRRGSRPLQLAPPDEKLVQACASADLLLALVVLDPSLGGDYLTTWASDVVVTVTAGQSTATRIQAVGEMIKLTGADPVSAVLIGADKTDESLGVSAPPPQDPVRASWGDTGS